MCKINVVSSSIYLVLVKIDNMYCKHYYRIHLYVLLVYNQAFLKAYLVNLDNFYEFFSSFRIKC